MAQPDPAKQRHGQPWQLNLDVLLLIAAWAHPCDLLSFASTCKRFRELLMDKSSALVWKAVRSKFEGLPDCPADLTELEYTDLAFSARCHGCGKYEGTVLWEIRRRYCSKCRVERLCNVRLCHEIIQNKYVLGMEHLSIGKETPLWVDREQMESFMRDYMCSSDKGQLLGDRQEQLAAKRTHARRCERWQRTIETPLRRERDRSIFERLMQLGYGPDIEYSGRGAIRESWKFLFNTTKPLTDKEWDRIWPEWLETINDFQLQRLERTVYQSRRRSLVDEYNRYVAHPSQSTPSFDLLPHVADVARFPPFRDIIRAPEGTRIKGKLFKSAFAQLPGLVGNWKKQLEAELAELVEIPPGLSMNDPGGDQVIAPAKATSSESCQVPTNKLRLACALFRGGSRDILAYPEVFFTAMRRLRYPSDREDDSERNGSIKDRFGVSYIKVAPYVVRACGLDPNVATADDMDRRNARLECLSCSSSGICTWREASFHAYISQHRACQADWRLVDDDSEEMAKVRDAERADGDEESHEEVTRHLMSKHDVHQYHIKEGVHYLPVSEEVHFSAERYKQRHRDSEFSFRIRRA